MVAVCRLRMIGKWRVASQGRLLLAAFVTSVLLHIPLASLKRKSGNNVGIRIIVDSVSGFIIPLLYVAFSLRVLSGLLSAVKDATAEARESGRFGNEAQR